MLAGMLEIGPKYQFVTLILTKGCHFTRQELKESLIYSELPQLCTWLNKLRERVPMLASPLRFNSR